MPILVHLCWFARGSVGAFGHRGRCCRNSGGNYNFLLSVGNLGDLLSCSSLLLGLLLLLGGFLCRLLCSLSSFCVTRGNSLRQGLLSFHFLLLVLCLPLLLLCHLSCSNRSNSFCRGRGWA